MVREIGLGALGMAVELLVLLVVFYSHHKRNQTLVIDHALGCGMLLFTVMVFLPLQMDYILIGAAMVLLTVSIASAIVTIKRWKLLRLGVGVDLFTQAAPILIVIIPSLYAAVMPLPIRWGW